jgi:hypothetical protein
VGCDLSRRTWRISLWVRFNVCLLLILSLFSLHADTRRIGFRQYRTLVSPDVGETLQDRCAYQLLLPMADHPVQSVFVIFERGWQLGNLYYSPEIVNFAANHQMGLLLAQHCRSKEREDMDVVPEHGIGPALFLALKQFASASDHPELERVPLAYMSFGWRIPRGTHGWIRSESGAGCNLSRAGAI